MRLGRGRLGRMGWFGATASALVLLGVAGCEEGSRKYPPPVDVGEERALPPVSGGTLLVTADQVRAVAADPDTDRVWTVRLDTLAVERVVELDAGDEPGRMVQDAAGLVHVALRGTGEIATIDPVAGKLLRRIYACAAPRGLDYDAATDHLFVACAEGKVLTVANEKGVVERSFEVGPDVRDVLFVGGRLAITRLRSPEITTLDAYGTAIDRAAPPVGTFTTTEVVNGESQDETKTFTPTVAWRTVKMPDGSLLMVHQRGQADPITTTKPSGYGTDPCGSIVHGALTRFEVDGDGKVTGPAFVPMRLGIALPVDVAVSADGEQIAVAGAGSRGLVRTWPAKITEGSAPQCELGAPLEGMPVGVAFAAGELVVLTRAPGAIVLQDRGIVIPLGRDRTGGGHRVFHMAPNGAVACASCHPEGREDGHTWQFDPIGPRRSQSLRGGVEATMPLHWDGDMEDVHAIMEEVFVKRMGGSEPSQSDEEGIAAWIEALPALPPLRDPEDEAALRGREVFERADVGCAACHSGARLTNNRNEEVGRAEKLQVPSLRGVAWRTPLMHDGCAATLRDRFDPACGGDQHGHVEQLSGGEVDDLVAYLESM